MKALILSTALALTATSTQATEIYQMDMYASEGSWMVVYDGNVNQSCFAATMDNWSQMFLTVNPTDEGFEVTLINKRETRDVGYQAPAFVNLLTGEEITYKIAVFEVGENKFLKLSDNYIKALTSIDMVNEMTNHETLRFLDSNARMVASFNLEGFNEMITSVSECDKEGRT